MEPCIPLPLQDEIYLKELTRNAQEWALTHGFVMRLPKFCNEDTVIFAPFTLLPSTFPKSEFLKAKEIQKDINYVMHRIAYDREFLTNTFKEVIGVDDFTARIFEIHETVIKEGVAQPYSLGLLRTDYLLHTPAGEKKASIKQVETNTISTSLGSLTDKTTEIHKYVLTQLGHKNKLEHLPANDTLKSLANGLVAAWKVYDSPQAVIMFLVEEVTMNVGDQRLLEFQVYEINKRARVIRKNFQDIVERGKLKGSSLFIDGYEVAVAYFRCGYVPSHFVNEQCWSALLMIERSRAIKCPTTGYHLAGCKKIQQVLSQPEVLEKFIQDPTRAELVRETFAGQYSLDRTENGGILANMGKFDPSKYVLKPQREGGGNNIYGQEILNVLEQADLTSQSAYILMERLFPPEVKNYMVRPGLDLNQLTLNNVVSELGIYGVILGSADVIVVNDEVGHLLRTKSADSNEGGVAAGFGCLDSPFLI